ncbi:hypothetical protein [Mesorhizobium sp. CAU 1741]|uniref:hypothetical protein n=1 Tax=Mesorhizobium sp. CAU 1741 TaxID=3140366 RepID=UPI00325BB7EB
MVEKSRAALIDRLDSAVTDWNGQPEVDGAELVRPLNCGEARAIRSLLSSAIPGEVAELVDGLNSWAQEDTGSYEAGVRLICSQAATALTSLAARVEALEAVVGELVRANDEGPGLLDCIDNHGERYTSAGLDAATRAARLLLKKDRKA